MTRPSTRRDFLKTVTAAASTVGAAVLFPSFATGQAGKDGWDLGPFVKRQDPVLRPTADSRFRCPVRGKEVRWEERNEYNPAVMVREGKVHLLYRADDRSPDLVYAGGVTELGPMRANGTGFKAEDRIDREWQLGPAARFRLLLKGSLIEFYLEDLLIDCYSLPQGASGRIGILPAGDPAALTALKAWCP